MEYAKLFSSIEVSGLKLKNRIGLSPLYVGYQTPGGLPSELTLEHYGAIARGGAGMVIVEASAINLDQTMMGRVLRVYDKEHIEPLKKLASVIHEHGAVAVLQLNHMGRFNFLKPLAPSVVPVFKREPQEMTPEDIAQVQADFANAAGIVKAAGFDMVELHGGTGYLLSEFLSPRTNKRDDKYGGSLDNRMRFGLETLAAVRDKVGNDFPVGYRLLADEYMEDGTTLEDSLPFAKELEAAGAAYINVMGGTYESFALPDVVKAAGEEGHIVKLTAPIKDAVSVPVMGAGKILQPAMAEDILAQGKMDIIGIGRGLLCDPEWPNKVREGRESEIDNCQDCHTCMLRVQAGKPVFCKAWTKERRQRAKEMYK